MIVRYCRFAVLIFAAAISPATAAPAGRGVEAARLALSQINAREVLLEARMGETRGELARLLGALELYGRDPPPALLVDPRDARDAVRAVILIRALTPTLEARARAFAVEARALGAARRQAAMASGELFAAESAIADRQGRLEGVTADADALTPPESRGAEAGLDRAATPKALLAPVQGEVTTGFGGRTPDGLRSRGLWFTAGSGAIVSSPTAGLVDYAGPLAGWGAIVILRGPGGCHMVLSGIGRTFVARGQYIAAGQSLGVMPATGHSAARLYFEFRLGGAPTDPSRLIARAGVAPTGLRHKLL